MKIFSRAELEHVFKLDTVALGVIRNGFVALAEDRVVIPPILSMDVAENNGEVDVKTAYIEGVPQFAIKVSPGFFENPKFGLPSLNGLMILFSSQTGLIEALLLDKGYLTEIRTALAGALAAENLANPGIKTVGIIGAGAQARLQAQALKLVRKFEHLQVWSIVPEEAEDYRNEMETVLGVPVTVQTERNTLVETSDLIVTTTPSREPLIEADCVRPGTHITAMGSDQAEKNELTPELLKKADCFVCDRISQSETLGELHHAKDAGITPETIAELGSVISGKSSGRQSEADITICDLTGTGVQDTAIAVYAFEQAVGLKLGSIFEE